MRMKVCWAGVLLAVAIAMAQTDTPAPAFEVVSIKVHTEGPSGSFPTPGRLTVGNRTLKGLILEYFHVKMYQIAGADGWMNSIPYDVVGKASGPANFSQMQAMVRTVLIDRFQLRFHRETKEMPTYWLLVAKNGPKIKPPDPSDTHPGGISNRGHFIQGWKSPIGQLVFFLGGELDMPLLDKTGLEGNYNFKLEWADDVQGGTPGELPDLQKPSLMTAVQEQLGLKLEVHPGPVEMFIIDHAEKPQVN
jgi:uncharacterized protein (TIGR03435 family)